MPRKKKRNLGSDCKCPTCIEDKEKGVTYCARCARPGVQCQTCNSCPNCVKHHKCPSCGKVLCLTQKDSICYDCGHCASPECCKCVPCVGCNRKTNFSDRYHGCPKCQLCNNCGACPCAKRAQFNKIKQARSDYKKRTSIADLILKDGSIINQARVTFHSSGRTEFKSNPLNRFLSVEMEVAGLALVKEKRFNPLHLGMETIGTNRVVTQWSSNLVEDVSLPSGGFEINTAPANGDRFEQQVQSICAVLREHGATVENDYDSRKRIQCCGLHVHADARDITYSDLRRFLLLYEHIEAPLYLMLPGFRRGSHFCQPCGKRYGLMVRANLPIPPQRKKKEPDPAKVGLFQAVYNKSAPDRSDKRSCPQETRYRSVNLHQYFYRGTIEFRHFYGTINPAEIIPWAELVGTILDYSIKTSDSQVAREIKTISPSKLLLKVAGERLEPFVKAQWDRFKDDEDFNESPLLGERVVIANAARIERGPDGGLRWMQVERLR